MYAVNVDWPRRIGNPGYCRLTGHQANRVLAERGFGRNIRWRSAGRGDSIEPND